MESLQAFLWPAVIALWVVIIGYYVHKLSGEDEEETTDEEESAEERPTLRERWGEAKEWLEEKHDEYGPYWWRIRPLSFPVTFLLVITLGEREAAIWWKVLHFLFLELVFTQWAGVILYTLLVNAVGKERSRFDADPQKKTYYDALLKTARELASKGEYEKALRSYRETLNLDPENTEILYLVGACYYKLGKDDKARSYWKRILRIDPGHAKAQMWLAELEALRTAEDRVDKFLRAVKKAGSLMIVLITTSIVLVGVFVIIDSGSKSAAKIPTRSRVIEKAPPLPVVSFDQNPVEAKHELVPKSYKDVKGFFQVNPPDGWRIQAFKQDPRGKVVFLGPQSKITIIAQPRSHKTLQDLQRYLSLETEARNIEVDVERIKFLDREAIQRKFAVPNRQFLEIDFLTEAAEHRLEYSATPRAFEKQFPAARKSFETYQPLR